jgi:hypothetical protein
MHACAQGPGAAEGVDGGTKEEAQPLRQGELSSSGVVGERGFDALDLQLPGDQERAEFTCALFSLCCMRRHVPHKLLHTCHAGP